MESQVQKNNLAVPIAIVIAGALIAGAVFFSMSGSNTAGALQPQGVEQPTGNLEAMKPIASTDHIRGNSDAKVTIVEYSDFECPFCKRFHETMRQIKSAYGDDQVAWVYRQFPLDQLHSQARQESVASECAAELGGNGAFWKFADRFFELTPSNDQTDIETVLPKIAKEIGLNATAFTSCLTSGKYDNHIEEDVQGAVTTGGNGTPWSILVTANGKKVPISGAQPYEQIKAAIDAALASQ